MTPTKKITIVHAVKLLKDSDNYEVINEEVQNLRQLVFSKPDVKEEIKNWMESEPVVNENEIKDFLEKYGK